MCLCVRAEGCIDPMCLLPSLTITIYMYTCHLMPLKVHFFFFFLQKKSKEREILEGVGGMGGDQPAFCNY